MKNNYLLLTWVLLSVASSLQAQIVGADAFLKGDYVQVGINFLGGYGSDSEQPADYANPNGTGIGFIADPDRDGFDMGALPFIGDYFLPGFREESWSVVINGTPYANGLDVSSYSAVSGGLMNYIDNPDTVSVQWVGTQNGLEITQTSMVPKNALLLRTKVALTNTTAATINNVYYARNVDPDPDADPIVLPPGDTITYSTLNTIISQSAASGGSATVRAVGLNTNGYVYLTSDDSRARVTHGGFSNHEADIIYGGALADSDLYDVEGDENYDDAAISIAFFIGDIPAGETRTITYDYVLENLDSAGEVEAEPEVVRDLPSMGQWQLIILGLTTIFIGGLFVKRRGFSGN